jgi:hypothetical protein
VGACQVAPSTRHPPGTFSTGTRQLPLPDKHPSGSYFPGARPAQFKSGALLVPLIRRLSLIFGCLGIFYTGRAPPLCGAGSVPLVLGYRFGAMSTGAGQAPLPLRQNASIYSVSILPPSSRLFASWYTDNDISSIALKVRCHVRLFEVGNVGSSALASGGEWVCVSGALNIQSYSCLFLCVLPLVLAAPCSWSPLSRPPLPPLMKVAHSRAATQKKAARWQEVASSR